MARNNSNTRLVYSTDGGRAEQPSSPNPQGPPTDGVVRISRETKGRKGKGMTIITGVPLRGDDLKDLAKQLKQKCGTGGTVKGDVIEIQGDHRDKLVTELSARGWTVKKAGG
jgi:translation initiation factor 1